MRRVGGTNGSGQLVAGGEELGPVEYRLDVYESNRVRDGGGSLQGAFDVLYGAFEKGGGTLRLQDGREVDIVIKNLNGGGATFLTSGAVPGF